MHRIAIDQDLFVLKADRSGIATTADAHTAPAFRREDLLDTLYMLLWHKPRSHVTLIPISTQQHVLQEDTQCKCGPSHAVNRPEIPGDSIS